MTDRGVLVMLLNLGFAQVLSPWILMKGATISAWRRMTLSSLDAIPLIRVEKAYRLSLPHIKDTHSPVDPSIGLYKMQFTVDSSGRCLSLYRAYPPVEILHLGRIGFTCAWALWRANCVFPGIMMDRRAWIRGTNFDDVFVNVRAKCEVILCCGALRTPQPLLLSGVGSRKHLQEMNVDIVLDSPGVGEHLVASTLDRPSEYLISVFVARPPDSAYRLQLSAL
ncbi:hypothetical protein EV401DRAFT_362040 [Pisolithus croceorrhizus]|nr:hypothetical protein EV401DRAFT_362040 [Pisolithus croceorrhizus]